MALPNNPVPDDVYPSSSQDGQAIPLAAVRPTGSIKGQLTAGGTLVVALPEGVNLVSFFAESTGGTLLLGEASSGAGFNVDTFVFLPGVMYELVLPSSVSILSEGPSMYFINVLTKWGQIRNHGSYFNS